MEHQRGPGRSSTHHSSSHLPGQVPTTLVPTSSLRTCVSTGDKDTSPIPAGGGEGKQSPGAALGAFSTHPFPSAGLFSCSTTRWAKATRVTVPPLPQETPGRWLCPIPGDRRCREGAGRGGRKPQGSSLKPQQERCPVLKQRPSRGQSHMAEWWQRQEQSHQRPFKPCLCHLLKQLLGGQDVCQSLEGSVRAVGKLEAHKT